MAELLLELFSEEIPARMQLLMAEKLKNNLEASLREENIYFQDIKTYATPRRLVASIAGMSLTQEDMIEEKRGPRTDAPQQAIDGFLRSTGLTIQQLEKRDTKKGEFYFAVKEQRGKPTREVLKMTLEKVIPNLVWPKSMRWGDSQIRWVRPLKNILCVFGGEVLPFKFGNLVANDISYGHRFLSDGSFKATNLKDLKTKLNDNYVILDSAKRREIILQDAIKLAESKNLELLKDEGLLNEVAGLVEYPVTLLGKIDDEFMHLPEECLVSSIKIHQKYFCLKDKSGKLAPYFIVVSNMKSDDNGAGIVAGNEKVLRARLCDAKFFWDQDHKITLGQRGEALDRVIFHAKLGTIGQKIERIKALAKFIAVWVPHADLDQVERAASLCKSDLVTEMVGEFPDLQGIMGRYYAISAGEDVAIADAIAQHYSPVGASDNVPTAPISIAVAIADKVDTLCGLFAAGQKPTGSKDPFALRRSSLGIIRIILENKLAIPLRILLENALKLYPKSLFKYCEDIDKKSLLGKQKQVCTTLKPSDIADELMGFFEDRLKFLLKAENVRHDLISAVFASGDEDDLLRVVQRVAALDQLISSEDGANLLSAYKRATNIVRIEEEKDKRSYDKSPSQSMLEQVEEKDLYDAIFDAKPKIKAALKEHDFTGAMAVCKNLRNPIDRFFENVIVNSDNASLRKNRLKILASMSGLLNEIADFSEIEG